MTSGRRFDRLQLLDWNHPRRAVQCASHVDDSDALAIAKIAAQILDDAGLRSMLGIEFDVGADGNGGAWHGGSSWLKIVGLRFFYIEALAALHMPAREQLQNQCVVPVLQHFVERHRGRQGAVSNFQRDPVGVDALHGQKPLAAT
jgi:hypothetical protein